MQIHNTKLKDCFILEPNIIKDSRGYFFESFNQKTFEQLTGKNGNFVQDNQSSSSYGVIRGLHFQKGAYAQSKLIRVLKGEILDVAVDLRRDSPTYKQWVGVELSAENNLQLYIPQGFAHGFSVLSEQAVVAYKCDQFYLKSAEAGINYNDPELTINWGIPSDHQILSERDMVLPFLKDAEF